MKSVILSLAVALASAAPAMSVAVWGQCGVRVLYLGVVNGSGGLTGFFVQGSGYSGSTVCDSGSTCVTVNDCTFVILATIFQNGQR